jgi:hypothetical protein
MLSCRNGGSFAGALCGGKTSGRCIDDDAVEVVFTLAGVGVPRSEVRDTVFMKIRYPFLVP